MDRDRCESTFVHRTSTDPAPTRRLNSPSGEVRVIRKCSIAKFDPFQPKTSIRNGARSWRRGRRENTKRTTRFTGPL